LVGLIRELDELVLPVLERLHDLIVPDRLVLEIADLRLADRPVVFLVYEVEANVLLCTALSTRTGTFTSPNEIEPV
jgi:hypothetical protein